MWEMVSPGKEIGKMSAPVLSHWWHVGEAARHLLTNYEDWKLMSQAVTNANNKNTTKNEIASWLYRYLHSDPLKAQLEFVVWYHMEFFHKQMLWLQDRDQQTGEPAFRSHHMPVRVFIMRKGLNKMEASWKTHPKLQAYRDIIESLPMTTEQERQVKQAMDKFADIWLSTAISRFEKNFKQWRTNLVQFSLAGNEFVATEMAGWVEEEETGENEVRYITMYSEPHQTTINLPECINYVTAEIPSKQGIK